MPWGPDGRRAAVTISFDNLGEVSELGRGQWPQDAPLGEHFSVTRALPRVEALLAGAGVRASFFVEGLNAELYPDTLVRLAEAGHEVALHGWCHEPWAELDAAREADLLDRGRRATAAIGLPVTGFRPPGGRLTPASPTLLRAHGFTYCSPAGTGSGAHAGITALPFSWPLVDAYYVLPRFASLRARDLGADTVQPPATFALALRAALDAALDRGRLLVVLFHPFLLDDPARLAVLREHATAVARLAGEGVVWCAPAADVAAWLREGPGRPGDLQLDPTIA